MAQWLVLPSPVGELTLAEENGALTGLYFGTRCLLGEKGTSPLLEEAARQLQEYFAGCRREFFLPLAPRGTEFQRQVWHALEGIPYGETRTYGEIARAIGKPKACRAVGMPWGVFSRAFVCLRFSKRPLPRVCGCGKVRKGFARKTGL